MSVSVLRTIELDALQIFKAVVDFGGVTRAAAQLHRVPSNVTTRLKQLEEGLGTKLFHRHSRKLLLSSEGHLLLAYAEQLLRLSSEAELALRSGKPRGKLRIGTLESTAAARLPPVLARYHRANPEVQIELVTGTTGALLEQVSRYAIEAAFVAERFESGDLEMTSGFSRKASCNRPEGNYRDQKAGGYSGYDRDCLWGGLLLPANSGGMAGSFKNHSSARFGIWVLSCDRRLRRCGFWNCCDTSFGRSRITRGERGEHFAATDSVYGSHDISCLAQRTSFCCSRRLTS